MKITSMRAISGSEIQLRNFPPQWVFEQEEGVIGADGDLLCPTCGCCSLKQVPELFLNIFGRPREVLVLVCVPGGCTKTKSHAHRTRH